MNRSNFRVYAASAILLFSACSKKSTPAPEIPEPEEPKKEGVFVISATPGLGRADILYTVNRLDSGELITEGTGVEQSGSRNFIINNDMLFSLKFGGAGVGAVTAYKINEERQLEKVTDFQTETMHVRGNAGDDILMMKQAWQPAEDFTQWYRFNTKTLQIENQGEFNSEELAGVEKNEKAFFTSFTKVGDKIFAPYWSIVSGQAFMSDYLDSNWIAVYNYPAMTLDKVIRDGRTGSIGAYFASGLEVDENEDIYVFGTKLTYRGRTDTLSDTPSGIMKIKKNTTEYDQTYFLDISKVAGKGQYVYRKMYLGKGNFLLTMGERKSYNPYGTTLALFYPSLIRFAIVNVYDGTFKWVSGTPDPSTIGHTSSDYSDNYSALDGTGYLAITYGTFGSAKSTVYKFDAATATATPGLTTKEGSTTITAINWVPVSQ